MRFLFTAKAGSLGHLLPLLPLASASSDAGHEVAIATSIDRRDVVEEAGLGFFPAGLSLAEAGVRAREIFREWPWGPDLDHTYSEFFTKVQAPHMAADLDEVVASFRPDVVVSEVAEFGGPLVAAAAGIPLVSHGWGLPIPRTVAHAAGGAMAPLWRARGLEPRPYGGLYDYLYLDLCPPSFGPHDGPEAARVQPLRPVSVEGRGDRPDWLDRLPPRPTVYVTFGTAGAFNRETRVVGAVLDGLASHDVNVVVTVGSDTDLDSVGPVPANAHVGSFVPQAHLLPTSRVVVTHGGSGTVFGALSFGRPILVLPMGADQFRNADAVTRAGAGLVLQPEDVSAESISEAVNQLLSNPRYQRGANRIEAEIAEMPLPEDVLSVLESVGA